MSGRSYKFDADTISTDRMRDKVKNFSPLPITEECLKKFGFDSKLAQFNVKGRFILDGYGMNEIEIKYVHQLQNLYFALTGEELKTK